MTTPDARYERWRLTAVTVWAAIGVLVLVAAALWGLGRISSALVPFVLAFIMVFLLNWPVRALSQRGVPRGTAAILCIVAALLVVGGLLTLMGPFVARQIVSFANAAPAHLVRIEAAVQSLEDRYADIAFPQWVGGIVAAASSGLTQIAMGLGNNAARFVVSTGGGLAHGLFDIVIAIVIAFWALKDLPKLRDEITVLVGPKYEADAEHLISTVTRVVGGYLRGQTIASATTGSLTAIGLLIIGVPYWFMLGLITFFFNYAPYVGPFASAVIAGLVGLFKGPWTAVLAIGVLVLAQQITDNFVSPRVMSEQVDLHPILVIFSLLVGGTLFGIPGLLFAIPVAATGKGLFVYYYEKQTDRSLASKNGALFRGAGADIDQATTASKRDPVRADDDSEDARSET